MTAVACGIALDLPLATIRDGIAATRAVPGRLEPIADPGGRFIYVDYAHTPDALANVLQALDALRQRRIICVFGCGGDRDRRKRPLMGEIAGRLSDLAVVTSDNPRTEDPMAIIADALEGVRRTAPRAYTPDTLATPRTRWATVAVNGATSWCRIGARPSVWPFKWRKPATPS
jgi:UDP-N-acetylmuramyl tripeptide synthase